MIVSCEKEKLNDLVQTALRAVSSRVTMPILSGLLFNAENGRLTSNGTDLEISIRAEMDADVQESGSTVVSGRLIGDVVKSLPGGEVRIETADRFLTVKSAAGEYRIKEMMPEDFPQIPNWEGESVLKVPAPELLLAVQQTSRASSTDEKRPVLTGSLLEKNVGEGMIRVVATDSYRLAWRDVAVTGSLGDWEDCIIPTKTLNEVARLAGGAGPDIGMKIQEKQAMFKMDDLVVRSRLIEGQFPNYRQLMPKGERTTVKVDRDELISVVRRALIFGHNLRVGVFRDHLRVNTETPEVGDSKEEIPAEVEGEEMEIGFNGTYLVDGITAVDSEKVEIKMDEPLKPSLIRPDGSEKFIYILMPVRLR
jgi:DNA polymerase-3 subunit beta